LKVLAKGDRASIAGETVDELCVVVSGRLAAALPRPGEAGQGDPVEAKAFFTRGPAETTLVALRETVLLTLAWEGLTAAAQANPSLLTACLSRIWQEEMGGRVSGRLSRLAICPAGSQMLLDAGHKEGLLAALESVAEVRLLSPQSFGAGK